MHEFLPKQALAKQTAHSTRVSAKESSVWYHPCVRDARVSSRPFSARPPRPAMRRRNATEGDEEDSQPLIDVGSARFALAGRGSSALRRRLAWPERLASLHTPAHLFERTRIREWRRAHQLKRHRGA